MAWVVLLSGTVQASAAAPLTASGGQWALVWQDEFDGDRINSRNWELESNCWGGGNAEQQCYTARKDDQPQANAYVADGILHIVARKEDFSGPATPDGSVGAIATLPYTSARLRTRGRHEWSFGRFEIRAQLPRGQGSWPAIWMLPTDGRYGGWAASGEIDIMEAVNLGSVSDAPDAVPGSIETRVHGTLHYGGRSPGNVHAGSSYRLPGGANPADGFHVYALEWEEGEMRWYVDGVHYATQRAEHWYSQPSSDATSSPAADAPFDAGARFHLLLNLAVGGNWAGNANAGGIDAAAFPQTMQVDYVRVYQCSANPVTGKGCATIGADAVLVRPERTGQFPVLP